MTKYISKQVKAATGEEVSAEDLGGADLHCGSVNIFYMSIYGSWICAFAIVFVIVFISETFAWEHM